MIRIGFTGAGGTGKGTLAQKIAQELGLTYLPTPLTEIGAKFKMQNYQDHGELEEAIAYQFAALHAQIYQEKGLQFAGLGYVAERTSLDYVPYWCQKVGIQKAFLDRVYRNIAKDWALNAYTMIVYCPPEFTPKDTQPWKERNQEARKDTDRIIKSLLGIVGQKVPVIQVSGTPEGRFNQIMSALLKL